MQIRFIAKDGTRFMREVLDLPKQFIIERDEDPQSNPAISKLARALFDKKLSAEATRIGEGNPQRVLDIMWEKTRLQERDNAMTEALALTVIMGSGQRKFNLHKARNGGMCYVEIGCVFTDLTAADAPAPVKPSVREAWCDNLPEPITEKTLSNQELSGEKLLQALKGDEEDALKTFEANRQERQRRILDLEDKFIAEENASWAKRWHRVSP